jgi:arginyl-tRNA synthetase
MLVTHQLRILIEHALKAAIKDGALGPVTLFPEVILSGDILVERPKQSIHGDLTCGVALKLASGANMPPFAIAHTLASYIRGDNDNLLPANAITELSIAPEGFLNFKLGSAWLSASLVEIHKAGEHFGKNKIGKNQKVAIDYGSPLRSRNTIYGQSLANLFRWSGYQVCEDPHSADADFNSFDLSINILAGQNNKKIDQLKELKKESGLSGQGKREVILLQPVKQRETASSADDDNDPRSIAEQRSTTLVDIGADAEILNTIDDDILRFCLVNAEPQDQTTLDPELSRQACRNNSAFYVRYAHARCCALIRQALDSRINVNDRLLDPPLLSEAQFQDYLLQYKSDNDVFEKAFSINSAIFSHQKKLVMALQSFPFEISEALWMRQPGRIARFARVVADDLNKWYEVNRVISDNAAVTRANLGLIMATRQVLANALAVIGVSAPTIM